MPLNPRPHSVLDISVTLPLQELDRKRLDPRQNTDPWRFLARSAGASFCNIMITFPINKIMFRQQAEGHAISQAIANMRNEGLFRLYRGILPPLMQKSLSVAIMFGVYDNASSSIMASSDYSPHIARAAAAMLAGSTEALLSPFERVQVLLQSRRFNSEVKNSSHALKLLRPHGAAEYFRGLSVVLLRNGPSNVIFFGAREACSELLPTPNTDAGVLAHNFLSGALVGALISALFFPLNVARIQMQDRIGGPRISIWQALQSQYIERGHSVKALYRGLTMNAGRACVGWGIVNASYEYLKRIF